MTENKKAVSHSLQATGQTAYAIQTYNTVSPPLSQEIELETWKIRVRELQARKKANPMNAPTPDAGYLDSLVNEAGSQTQATTEASGGEISPTLEAEQAVLAGILIKKDVLPAVLERITASDFGNLPNRKIFSAIQSLHLRSEAVDIITVMAELGQALEEIGGAAYLSSLTSIPFSVRNVESYVGIILKASERRKLLSVATMIQEGLKAGQDHESLTGAILNTIETARARTTGAGGRRFTFSPLSSLLAEQTPATWLIFRFMEKSTLISLFGPPETLKTFIALSMGFSVATGCDWFGYSVKHQGPVLYLCGEGRRAIAQRGSAWLQENGFPGAPFYVSSGPAALLDPTSLAEVDMAIKEIPDGPPALIIIDTLNRNFGPGDENSTGDMTRFVSALDRLKDHYECAILVLHHTGLADQNRGRGNSSLHGAVDFQYTVKRSDNDSIVLTCSKCKDHQRPEPIAFKSKVIDLGRRDDDGHPITSLVLEHVGSPIIEPRQKVTPSQRIALDALAKVSAETGKGYIEDWRQAAYRAGIAENSDAKKKAFSRARTSLLDSGIIKTDSDFYWIHDGGTRGTKGDIVSICPDLEGDIGGHIPKGMSPCPPVPKEQVEVLI
ncbi:MAG: AAA family ATPase [Desulfobulbaceae bacterium]|nr:MAG: AAA family ATPase [Desulfobulbaceae bacterium]